MRTKTLYQWSFGGLLLFIVAAFTVMLSETLRTAYVRGGVYLLTTLGLMGCATSNYTLNYEMPAGFEVAALQTPVSKSATEKGISAAPKAAPTTIGTAVAVMLHGRFIVEVGDKLHEIQGGVFTPPTVMPVKSMAAHVLISNYSTKELLYYRKTKTGSYEPIIGYAVVTPKPEELPLAQVRGKVTRIETKPTWCPGPQGRKKDPTLPAGCLPPGHPQNAMGAAKIVINWQGVKDFVGIHIHGAEGYSTNGAFWNEETLGCTRLENSAILALIDLLGTNAVKEGIEVVLERGDTLQRHAL